MSNELRPAHPNHSPRLILAARRAARFARALALSRPLLHAHRSSHKGALQTVCSGIGLGHPATAVADVDLYGDLLDDCADPQRGCSLCGLRVCGVTAVDVLLELADKRDAGVG